MAGATATTFTSPAASARVARSRRITLFCFVRFMSSPATSILNEVELFPWPDGRAVRDQGCRARVLRCDVRAVRVGPQAHAAVAVVHERERLPLADGGTVGGQCRRASVLGGDVLVVGVGPQRDRA